MVYVSIYKFDDIIEITPDKQPETMRDLCFRPLPNAHFKDGIEDTLRRNRAEHTITILIAAGNEMSVKEAIYKVNGCELFDHIIIVEELSNISDDFSDYSRLFPNFIADICGSGTCGVK